MPDIEIISGCNDVSVFRHHTGSKIILGPVAFINSSCRENCCYVSNSKRTKVNILLTKYLEFNREMKLEFYTLVKILDQTECITNVRTKSCMVVQNFCCRGLGQGEYELRMKFAFQALPLLHQLQIATLTQD